MSLSSYAARVMRESAIRRAPGFFTAVPFKLKKNKNVRAEVPEEVTLPHDADLSNKDESDTLALLSGPSSTFNTPSSEPVVDPLTRFVLKVFPGSRFVTNNFLMCVSFGFVASLVMMPSALGKATVIFQHELLAPSLPLLVKLVFLSAAINIGIYATFDKLPYAIAGVQDVPTIFLASMCTTIAQHYQDNPSLDVTHLLPTVLFLIGFSSVCVGVAHLIFSFFPNVIARIHFIPIPVLGGFIASMGVFLLQGGLKIGTGLAFKTWSEYLLLFHINYLHLVLPTVGFGLLLFILQRFFYRPWVLPATLFVAVCCFYILVRGIIGLSGEEATEKGFFFSKMGKVDHFYDSWAAIDFSRIDWEVIQDRIGDITRMSVVFIISTLLNLSAVETALDKDMSYRRELAMCGLCNILGGSLGGLGCSRFVSTTVLGAKQIGQFNSRVGGWVDSLVFFILFFADIPIIEWIPKFFFGGVLILIGAELFLSWVWDARKRLMKFDLVVVWISLLSILYSGLNLGLVLGIIAALLIFDFQYTTVSAIKPTAVRPSTAFRVGADRNLVSLNRDHIKMFHLEGYLFFGTARSIIKTLETELKIVREGEEQAQPLQFVQQMFSTLLPSKHGSSKQEVRVELTPTERPPTVDSDVTVSFVIFDCHHLRGLDASALSIFQKAKRLLVGRNTTLVFAQLPPAIESWMQRSKIIQPLDETSTVPSSGCYAFPSIDDALEFCEESLLRQQRMNRLSVSSQNMHLSAFSVLFNDLLSEEDLIILATYLEHVVMPPREWLFRQGDPADSVWLLESGHIQYFKTEAKVSKKIGSSSRYCLVGELDSFSSGVRTFGAQCKEECHLLKLSMATLARMQKDTPDLSHAVLRAVIRSTSLFLDDSLSRRIRNTDL